MRTRTHREASLPTNPYVLLSSGRLPQFGTMRPAGLSLAVLFAPAAVVTAYVCNYRGTGSQSIYPTFVTLPENCTQATQPTGFCSSTYVRRLP